MCFFIFRCRGGFIRRLVVQECACIGVVGFSLAVLPDVRGAACRPLLDGGLEHDELRMPARCRTYKLLESEN